MTEFQSGPVSRAAMAGCPIQAVLTPFPVGLLVGALASDINFWATGNAFWAARSFWLAAAGFLTAVAVAAVDCRAGAGTRRDRVRRIAMAGKNAVALLALLNVLLRVPDAAAVVLPWGLALSAAVVLVLWLSFRPTVDDGGASSQRR